MRESRQKSEISVEKVQLSLHTLRVAERHITLYSAPS